MRTPRKFAICLQRVFRGHSTRKKIEPLRRQLALRVKAAIKLQCRFRVAAAKKQMKRIKSKHTSQQNSNRAILPDAIREKQTLGDTLDALVQFPLLKSFKNAVVNGTSLSINVYEDIFVAYSGDHLSPQTIKYSFLSVAIGKVVAKGRTVKAVDSKTNMQIRFKSDFLALAFANVLNEPPFRTGLAHGFASSFPERGALSRCFRGGAAYFDALADAIARAKFSIFISGWWVAPEIYLKRHGGKLLQEYRLDNLLQTKARHGVRICILLFHPFAVLQLNSANAKKRLCALHENINVKLQRPNPTNIKRNMYSHHQKFCVVDQVVAFAGGIDIAPGRYDSDDVPLWDSESVVFPGVDFYNPCRHEHSNSHLDTPFKDVFDRNATPRMPWQDVQVQVHGLAARDVGLNFIQRWNGSLRNSDMETVNTIVPVPRIWCAENANMYDVSGSSAVILQVVRSFGSWSGGQKESSVYNAYMHAIKNSKRFIYIENQFFISGGLDDGTSSYFFECKRHNAIKNEIGGAIAERIIAAIVRAEPFFCFIILPAHPEGPLDSDAAQHLSYFQRVTLSKMKAKIKRECPSAEPSDYFGVYCLRKAGKNPATSLIDTEQCYVHSKLMIVDDDIMIASSANINDRSMKGPRDTEIGFRIRRHPDSPSFIGDFRVKLMNFHTGIGNKSPDALVFRCVNKVSINMWKRIACQNTRCLEVLFPSIPSSEVKTLSVYRKKKKEWAAFRKRLQVQEQENKEQMKAPKHAISFNVRSPWKTRTKQLSQKRASTSCVGGRVANWKVHALDSLGKISGTLCTFPLGFLENMTPSILDAVPDTMWT